MSYIDYEQAKRKRKKPCPFCAVRGKELELVQLPGAPATYAMFCYGCGTEGPPIQFEPAKAVEAWNQRLTKPLPLSRGLT